jgi:hypothetical protein
MQIKRWTKETILRRVRHIMEDDQVCLQTAFFTLRERYPAMFEHFGTLMVAESRKQRETEQGTEQAA